MTAVYDLEVRITHDAAKPFRVAAVQGEQRVRDIVESFLAAWGRPVPAELRDTDTPFVELLAAAGHYRSDTPDALVIVKRSE